ncbi:hypothetical protein JOD18_003285 [Gracilibacillus alcaliphilus]|nr:hypothetical protein [Gracilibacillus alcaliphilus]
MIILALENLATCILVKFREKPTVVIREKGWEQHGEGLFSGSRSRR